MKVFNLREMNIAEGKQRVFYSTDFFKARIIELEAGEGIPDCQMEAYVLFTVLTGEVKVQVNTELTELLAEECLITGPATLSMHTENGVRLMGIQIEGRG